MKQIVFLFIGLLFCTKSFVFGQKAPHMSVDACKEIKEKCPKCYEDCAAAVNAQNKVADYYNSGKTVHSPLEDKRDAAVAKLNNCTNPCGLGGGGNAVSRREATLKQLEINHNKNMKTLNAELKNEREKAEEAETAYKNSGTAQNKALESMQADNYNTAGKIVNSTSNVDLESDNLEDPTLKYKNNTTAEKGQATPSITASAEAPSVKDLTHTSIESKIKAASQKYKGDCTLQHGQGTSFSVTELPGSEPCRFKNNMVYWSEWVPIGNNVEISYVPLSLNQDKMYSIADGMARHADYGYFRFRLISKHDPKVKIGGRLYIYYINDTGKEESTFEPMYFDAEEATKQEGMGMWYLGHQITKVVWDDARCWRED